MRLLNGGWREMLMTLLNLAGVYVFFFKDNDNALQGHGGSLLLAEYLGIVLFQYLALRFFSEAKGWLPWLAFFCPIAVLVILRYVPTPTLVDLLALVHKWTGRYFAVPSGIGLSYMAFRCSRLVLEVRNGSVKKPGLWQYLNFAFFLPTMSVGPINTYANHRLGFEAAPWEVPIGRAALRVLVGCVKCQFLGGMFNQLSYGTFLLNGHPHHRIDLAIAMVFYYLFLYCNFSGFCDMAIGVAALIGIPVAENFNNPFAARNVKDFWNRWHITLSVWMRDVVFSPLSKYLVGKFGVNRADPAIAIAITVVFLLIGIWHGVGWNYAAYGAAHALAVVANHYYTIFLKKRLGREQFKAYNENRWIHAVAVVLTFCYVSASMLLFANTFPEMKEIFSSLR
jgi:D-alanyl-lipoteichoic acid acyltransferase DltB (MBOAT superfamily)